MKIARDIFERPSDDVAPDLIGRRLFRRRESGLYELEIVETGAYKGIARGEGAGLMYPPGIIYIHVGQRGYRTLAIGTERKGEPSVVTIRQALELSGFESPNKLINGPGKLTNALCIGRELDGQPIDGDEIWLEGEAVILSLIEYISPQAAKMASNCKGYYRLKI